MDEMIEICEVCTALNGLVLLVLVVLKLNISTDVCGQTFSSRYSYSFFLGFL